MWKLFEKNKNQYFIFLEGFVSKIGTGTQLSSWDVYVYYFIEFSRGIAFNAQTDL